MNPPGPNSLSLAFVEGLYADYLRDPGSVPEDWRAHFDTLEPSAFSGRPRLGPSFRPASIFNPAGATASPGGNGHPTGARARRFSRREADVAALQDRADQLMRSYRVRGHLVARVDPLDRPLPPQPELDPSFYGFGEEDMDVLVSAQSFHGEQLASLGATVERMRNTYCRSIGVQFMHIDDLGIKRWLQERMEGTENRIQLSRDEQVRILTKLTDAVMFEEFIQKKYLGAKSFSLEGSESLIPLLDLALQRAGEHGIDEVVLGMAHRGRLNVMANILGKGPRQIFREFEDTDPELHMGRGDVKYHKGHSSDFLTECGHKVHLSLCFNPSHLEFVNPVALGRMRAKQDRAGADGHRKGLTLLIHGDAAFAGEGVVQESLNLSQLEAYSTGGTVHVVVNNQIGFTTGPAQSRSSTYCTDVAKMLQIPIFHVNGEDPEAVAQVVQMAMDFRYGYGRDVVIDMYAYRRRGHNEGDEPSFTDPQLYQAIARRKKVRESYVEHLLSQGNLTRAEADEIAERRRSALEEELSQARREDFVFQGDSTGAGLWQGYRGGLDADVPREIPSVPADELATLLDKLGRVPDGFALHPKLERFFDTRARMARGEKPLDWSAAEALALASLAVAGHPVRLTGQDSERGTFSHRHAVLHDVQDGKTWCPLQHLSEDQGPVLIRNSPLSETGVLGFEYGYSLDSPEALVAWEAQFGDFVNVAQVIIDQFIVSAEDKWQRLSGLVMLLPHGFEGQGPEHSSARLDRFLALSAEENIQVVAPSTPAQFYHCLRRQVLRPWRKPLVVMTPKSMLRNPAATSSLEDLAQGRFQRVLADPAELDAAAVRRIVLCSGKLFYDLAEEREKLGREDVAILRLEQYYPLDDADLEAALAPYGADVPVVWVQEEPENMGAWRYLRARFGERFLGTRGFRGIFRRASASPATGSLSSHRIEQQELLTQSFDID